MTGHRLTCRPHRNLTVALRASSSAGRGPGDGLVTPRHETGRCRLESREMESPVDERNPNVQPGPTAPPPPPEQGGEGDRAIPQADPQRPDVREPDPGEP